MTRKWSSFLLVEPRSKHAPQVSSSVQISRTRKKSSTASIGLSLPGTGRPSPRIRSASNHEDVCVRLTVTERDERPKCVKDHGCVHHAIHVQLPEVSDCRDPSLIVLEDVVLFLSSRISFRSSRHSRLLTSMPARMSSIAWSTTLTLKSG